MADPALADRYVLDRRIGGGGMAEVFLAHASGAEGFRRPVAIKRVLPAYSGDAAFAEMFIAEARLSAKLDHPNIVMVSDFDRDADGRLYLVMEFVDGASLDAVMAGGPLAVATALHIAAEMLRGLGHAHGKSVVHRDVSPHNVLLGWAGEVKVSDFGIAKAATATKVTASEAVKGKPAYMSPEQANGQELDERSDLFAVGVVLWEMLCGRALFAGKTTEETLARLLFAPVPSPRELRPELDADVERVVLRLLARDRDVRYATAEDALADLVACGASTGAGRDGVADLLAERIGGRTRPDHALAATVAAAVSPVPLPAPMDAPRPRRRRRDLLLGAAAGAAIVATIGAIVIAARGGDDGPGADTLIARANAALADRHYGDAAMLFRDAHRRTDDPEILHMIGDARRKAFDCAGAVEAYDQYIRQVGVKIDKAISADIERFREGCKDLLELNDPTLDQPYVKALINERIESLEQNARGFGAALTYIRGYELLGDTELLRYAGDALQSVGDCAGALAAYDGYEAKVDAQTRDAQRMVLDAARARCKGKESITRAADDPTLLTPPDEGLPDEPDFDRAMDVVDAADPQVKARCRSPEHEVYVSLGIGGDGWTFDVSVSPVEDSAEAKEFARCYREILKAARYPESKHGALWTNIHVTPN